MMIYTYYKIIRSYKITLEQEYKSCESQNRSHVNPSSYMNTYYYPKLNTTKETKQTMYT